MKHSFAILALLLSFPAARAEFPADNALPISASLPHYVPNSGISGQLVTRGSEVLEGMMNRWLAIFNRTHTKATVTFTKIKRDRGNVGSIGPDTEEIYGGFTVEPFVRKYGYDPLLVPISHGSFGEQEEGIFVNAKNPLTHLSLAELDSIYSTTRWRGAAPALHWGDVGATGAWAGRPIHPYGRGTDNQVSWWMREQVLLGGFFRPTVVVPGNGRSKPVHQAVVDDPDGICYLSFGEAAQDERLKLLSLSAAAGYPAVAPTPASYASGEFPLIRDYFICVNRRAGHPLEPLAAEYLRLILSAQGQRAVAESGCIPMADAAVRNARQLAGLEP